jgi:hypothetical protein
MSEHTQMKIGVAPELFLMDAWNGWPPGTAEAKGVAPANSCTREAWARVWEAARANIEERMMESYHPEFGTEWREDGTIGRAIEEAKAIAYKRGAEAMREAAAVCADGEGWTKHARLKHRRFTANEEGWRDGADYVAAAIRALPLPEDKR